MDLVYRAGNSRMEWFQWNPFNALESERLEGGAKFAVWTIFGFNRWLLRKRRRNGKEIGNELEKEIGNELEKEIEMRGKRIRTVVGNSKTSILDFGRLSRKRSGMSMESEPLWERLTIRDHFAVFILLEAPSLPDSVWPEDGQKTARRSLDVKIILYQTGMVGVSRPYKTGI